jgi:hypothetical protein
MAHAEDPNAVRTYGLVAEFESPDLLVVASRRAVQEGYRRLDAYTPFPIEELHEALGLHHTRVPLIVLVCGILGGLTGYGLEYWVSAIAYPLNIGGRPYHSWPAFIPVTFEMTVLFAAFGAVFGMLALNRLPMPYHPIFNAPRFALATRDRFFLCIESADPKYDPQATRRFLESFDPREVTEVEA